MKKTLTLFALLAAPLTCLLDTTAGAEALTVRLANAADVDFVGAIGRWDADGNLRALPDPKAKIDAPVVDAKADAIGGGRWRFENLPKGKYDLVILAKERVRIEGFQFAPVKEFDPFFPATATVDEETGKEIRRQIETSRHYENRVEPLYLGGDKTAVRALVMLLRDKPTSYESESPGAATIRHELWEFSWRYGVWEKEKRTKVLDRLLLPRDELRKWTWLWDKKLGGLEIKDQDASIEYEMPKAGEKKIAGLRPY